MTKVKKSPTSVETFKKTFQISDSKVGIRKLVQAGSVESIKEAAREIFLYSSAQEFRVYESADDTMVEDDEYLQDLPDFAFLYLTRCGDRRLGCANCQTVRRGCCCFSQVCRRMLHSISIGVQTEQECEDIVCSVVIKDDKEDNEHQQEKDEMHKHTSREEEEIVDAQDVVYFYNLPVIEDAHCIAEENEIVEVVVATEEEVQEEISEIRPHNSHQNTDRQCPATHEGQPGCIEGHTLFYTSGTGQGHPMVKLTSGHRIDPHFLDPTITNSTVPHDDKASHHLAKPTTVRLLKPREAIEPRMPVLLAAHKLDDPLNPPHTGRIRHYFREAEFVPTWNLTNCQLDPTPGNTYFFLVDSTKSRAFLKHSLGQQVKFKNNGIKQWPDARVTYYHAFAGKTQYPEYRMVEYLHQKAFRMVIHFYGDSSNYKWAPHGNSGRIRRKLLSAPASDAKRLKKLGRRKTREPVGSSSDSNVTQRMSPS